MSGGVDRYAGHEYARLLTAARKSLERTGGRLDGRIGVAQPDDAERKAIIGITGVHQPAGTKRMAVRLADLDDAMRGATGLGLSAVLAALGGQLRDRPGEAAALAAARAEMIATAQASPLREECAWYRAWLSELLADGTLTRLARHGDAASVKHAVRVLEYIDGRTADELGIVPIALPALAAHITGDTKALNHGTTLATLTLRALALRAGLHRPESAVGRRELWDLANVIVDDLASRVLVLNIAADGADGAPEGTGLAQWLTDAARHGTPFQVTLHQLASHPIRIRQRRIFVCENPAVLRRACEQLGARCPALVCTEGQPSTAFHRLMQLVAADRAEIWYHGDFDWAGVRIAAGVIGRHGAKAWRMNAGDYRRGAKAQDSYLALNGDPARTPWDPELGALMRATGRTVYEETVADQLLADLDRYADEASRRPPGFLSCDVHTL